MKPEDKDLTIQEFFVKYYNNPNEFNIDRKIFETLEVVNLKAPLDRIVKSFSG